MFQNRNDDDEPNREERARDDEGPDAPRYDGRIRPGECRNPYGRRGKPAPATTVGDISDMVSQILLERVTVNTDGKRESRTKLELLLRNTVHELIQTPSRHRIELLFGRRGIARTAPSKLVHLAA